MISRLKLVQLNLKNVFNKIKKKPGFLDLDAEELDENYKPKQKEYQFKKKKQNLNKQDFQLQKEKDTSTLIMKCLNMDQLQQLYQQNQFINKIHLVLILSKAFEIRTQQSEQEKNKQKNFYESEFIVKIQDGIEQNIEFYNPQTFIKIMQIVNRKRKASMQLQNIYIKSLEWIYKDQNYQSFETRDNLGYLNNFSKIKFYQNKKLTQNIISSLTNLEKNSTTQIFIIIKASLQIQFYNEKLITSFNQEINKRLQYLTDQQLYLSILINKDNQKQQIDYFMKIKSVASLAPPYILKLVSIFQFDQKIRSQLLNRILFISTLQISKGTSFRLKIIKIFKLMIEDREFKTDNFNTFIQKCMIYHQKLDFTQKIHLFLYITKENQNINQKELFQKLFSQLHPRQMPIKRKAFEYVIELLKNSQDINEDIQKKIIKNLFVGLTQKIQRFHDYQIIYFTEFFNNYKNKDYLIRQFKKYIERYQIRYYLHINEQENMELLKNQDEQHLIISYRDLIKEKQIEKDVKPVALIKFQTNIINTLFLIINLESQEFKEEVIQLQDVLNSFILFENQLTFDNLNKLMVIQNQLNLNFNKVIQKAMQNRMLYKLKQFPVKQKTIKKNILQALSKLKNNNDYVINSPLLIKNFMIDISVKNKLTNQKLAIILENQKDVIQKEKLFISQIDINQIFKSQIKNLQKNDYKNTIYLTDENIEQVIQFVNDQNNEQQ